VFHLAPTHLGWDTQRQIYSSVQRPPGVKTPTDAADTITCAEFSTHFRNYHISARLMKIKKKEFLSLKQGSMSVSEYHDRFIQLSRYAPDEVAEDERKQEHFIEGLNGPLQYALVAHTFPSFQRLLDKP
jgi:hypothetical protein